MKKEPQFLTLTVDGMFNLDTAIFLQSMTEEQKLIHFRDLLESLNYQSSIEHVRELAAQPQWDNKL